MNMCITKTAIGVIIALIIYLSFPRQITHKQLQRIEIGQKKQKVLLLKRDCGKNTYNTNLWRVSAYCPKSCCCGIFADGITASGEPAKGFFVAAPPEIPFYTRLAIPGYNDGLPVPVLDRGGTIQDNKLDIFFADHNEALNFGIHWLKVKQELEK